MDFVYDQGIAKQFSCLVLKKVVATFYFINFFSFTVRMSCNFGDRKFFLQLNSYLALNHIVLTTPKTLEKVILTPVEMQ